MPGTGYFPKMITSIMLGLLALVIAGAIFYIFLPILSTIFFGTAILIAIFVIIYAVTCVALFVGTAIYYAIRHPMKVEKKDKKYSIKRAKEAGRRQKE